MNTIARTPSKAGANTDSKPGRAMRRALVASALLLAAPLVARPAAAAAAILLQPAPDHELYIVDSPRQTHDVAPRAGLPGTVLQGGGDVIGGGNVSRGLRHAHDLSVSPPVRHMNWVLLRPGAPGAVPGTAPGPCAGLHRRQPRDLT